MELKPGFNGKSTTELIGIFQKLEETEETRNSAFIVLCSRFRKELLEKCEIFCHYRGYNTVVAEQIVIRAFRSYALKPAYIDVKSKSKSCDDGFLRYLYAIAKNETTNYFREEYRRSRGYYYDGSEKIITCLPDIAEDRLDVESRVIHAALKTLSKKHMVVYLTYKQYEISGFNLPRKLQAELRTYVGTDKQSTIRGLKKEANDKVQDYIEAMNITKMEMNGR